MLKKDPKLLFQQQSRLGWSELQKRCLGNWRVAWRLTSYLPLRGVDLLHWADYLCQEGGYIFARAEGLHRYSYTADRTLALKPAPPQEIGEGVLVKIYQRGTEHERCFRFWCSARSKYRPSKCSLAHQGQGGILDRSFRVRVHSVLAGKAGT